MWAGDNLLWEMRGPGADSVPGARLNDISAPAQEFGVVGYTHAGGIDRPLVVWKGIGATPLEVVVPHANWRGVYGKGTTSSGATSTVPIEWPGFKTTAYHSMGPSQQPTTNWMGSLIGGQRDPGGTMYMRNRYYDPQTGQFTQTDPIGIRGGLNTYGFAAGDPVSYDDPFGLAVCAGSLGLMRAISRTVNARITWTNNCVDNMNDVTFHGGASWAPIQAIFRAMVEAAEVYSVQWLNATVKCLTSCFQEASRTAYINQDEINESSWYRGNRKGCSIFRRNFVEFYNLEGVIAHELFGHGAGMLRDNGRGAAYVEDDFAEVKRGENMYHRAARRLVRCTKNGG